MRHRRRHAGGKLWGAVLFLLCGVMLLREMPHDADYIFLHGTEDIRPAQAETQGGNSAAEMVTEAKLSAMEVHYIDVGQGDATLIKNGEYAMLIDAGDNSKGTTVQNYLQKQGVEKLDYLVLTHTDADHIGGADVVITKLDIATVFMGDYEKENVTYRDVLDALEYKHLSWTTPRAGESFALGDATVTIIAPNGEYDTPNDTSIGLIVEKGAVRFAFTADAEKKAEADMVRNGMNLAATVYKVGHHGSSTSTSAELLDAMTPSYGVISCGKDNTYGYPHREIMTALSERGIEIFRTDEQGSIVAVCDGENIVWSTEMTVQHSESNAVKAVQ